ncbi:hypothetical protein ABE137_12140 [Brevibacillus laterosporus]|uniref:hypothetical protein n=1 Tax=Brevibacillus phage Sundance TaxID=1691958 RepID=UPI0006BD7742|nr:hypothetical protein AVT09_gp098 [Brevibacillus phage Sundance]ALA47914.1 hypothetical protein SUNDANCE_98 [Brevibacillus phage Sundance]
MRKGGFGFFVSKKTAIGITVQNVSVGMKTYISNHEYIKVSKVIKLGKYRFIVMKGI